MSNHARPSPRRGANAIEFSLTLPAFLFLVMGIMDYGYLFSLQSGLDNAVSLACREGSKIDPGAGGDPRAIAQADLNMRAAYFCNGACSTLAVTDLNSGVWAIPNRTLKCEAVLPNPPSIAGFVPFPTTIRSVSYYRLEWQRSSTN